MTIDHVLELDVILSDGTPLCLKELSPEAWHEKTRKADREGQVYRDFERLILAHQDDIVRRFPKVSRRSGGYALDAFCGQKPWNMAKLIAASEGTLACIVEAKVRLEPVPQHAGILLAHFNSLSSCLEAVAPLVARGPSAVELLDGLILRQAKQSRVAQSSSDQIEGDPEGLLIIESRHDDPAMVDESLAGMSAALKGLGTAYAVISLTEPEEIEKVWAMRSHALGLMTTVPGDRKPTPYIEDAAVPLEVLPKYIEDVLAICREAHQPVSLFAHAGVGLLHIRPLHNLHDPADRAQMKNIQQQVFDLVVKYKGSWSGEHGDGLVRGGFNRAFYGDLLYEAFKQVKSLFDPDDLFNPGKIVDSPPMDQNLRFHKAYEVMNHASVYQYRDFPDLMGAVEICTGIGACRKLQGGTMCPSYRATRDEAHSTRGRANALRLALSGQLGGDGLADPGLHEVLDLCLSCKGCKGECPNNVDLARLKAEALQARMDQLGAGWRDRQWRQLPALASRFAGELAPLWNVILRKGPSAQLVKRLLGVHSKRTLPAFTAKPLETWFVSRGVVNEQGPEVVLFNDVVMAYYRPEMGKAAVQLLEAAGYRVRLVRPEDSQRARISKGFLHEAKQRGQVLFEGLNEYAKRGLPIVCCEPSCWSSLVDDLPDLLDDLKLVESVRQQVFLIEDFICQELKADRIRFAFKPLKQLVWVHGHCHQKALQSYDATRALLEGIPGVEVRDSGAGCCGMAGSFGYEKDHYELSLKIASERLIPSLNDQSTGAVIIANGFSCQCQIHDLTTRLSQHVVEYVVSALDTKAHRISA